MREDAVNPDAGPDGLAGLRLPDVPDTEQIELDFGDVVLGGYLLEAPGAARAVLLLHGWSEDATTHLPLARLAREAGFHAATLSLRGSRGSSGGDDYGLRQPHDTVRALNWLRERTGVDVLHLFGYSQGGLVSLLALGQGAPVRSAAVLNAPTDLRGFARDTAFPFITRYLEAVCFDGRWDERSPLEHAADVRVPVLLVVSDADRHVPPGQAHAMHARLPGSTLRVLPGESHVLSHERMVAVWRDVLAYFHAT